MNKRHRGFHLFVLDVYRADGVSTAAVLLQDRCGVDVNVLLLAAYAGATTGASFTEGDVVAVVARTGAWQRDVVGPLRQVRRRLVDGPAPAPNPSTTALRERLQALELDAEMIELDELADVASRFDVSGPRSDASARADAAMRVVVRHGSAREPTDEENAAIAVMASAAARIAEGVTW